MRLLIAIPTKTALEYLERAQVCKETWLKNCPVDYKFFRDSDLGLEESHELIRQQRMKRMCWYALQNGYDFIFRVDSDAYVWIDRLLASGFEHHHYTGWCLEYPAPQERFRTAHGGVGFFLSRTAMEFVVEAEHFAHGEAYWGDIWTGLVLFKNGIRCNRDERFLEHGSEVTRAEEVPDDPNLISVHPVTLPAMRELYERSTCTK